MFLSLFCVSIDKILLFYLFAYLMKKILLFMLLLLFSVWLWNADYFQLVDEEVCYTIIRAYPETWSYVECKVEKKRVPYYGEIYESESEDKELSFIEISEEEQVRLVNEWFVDLQQEEELIISYDDICWDNMRANIVDLYYESLNCSFLETVTCWAYEYCKEVEESYNTLYDETIIDRFHTGVECATYSVRNHIKVEAYRCMYLVDALKTQEPQVEKAKSTTNDLQSSMGIKPQTMQPSIVYTQPQLSLAIENKIRTIKVMLANMWYDWSIVVPMVTKLKRNMIVGSEKYMIAEYLISLY